MSCSDRFAELVAGRALDALEPVDDALLDAHLPTCAGCRELLDELLATSAGLAHGVVATPPPPELWNRIRSSLPADATRSPLPVDDLAERRRRRRIALVPGRTATRLVAGLAAAAVLGVGVFGTEAVAESHHAHARLDAMQSVLGHLQQPGAYSVTLRSGGAATGTAVVDGRTVDLVTQDLGRNDRTSTVYVLWAASQQHPAMVAVATFDVTSDGQTVVTASLPSSIGDPTAFGVTHEKGRTAPATPGTSVLGTATSA